MSPTLAREFPGYVLRLRNDPIHYLADLGDGSDYYTRLRRLPDGRVDPVVVFRTERDAREYAALLPHVVEVVRLARALVGR